MCHFAIPHHFDISMEGMSCTDTERDFVLSPRGEEIKNDSYFLAISYQHRLPSPVLLLVQGGTP